jgi:hypothetical protein
MGKKSLKKDHMTIKTKIDILKDIDQKFLNQNQIGLKYGVGQSCISRINKTLRKSKQHSQKLGMRNQEQVENS